MEKNETCSFCAIVMAVVICAFPSASEARCTGTILNPITDVLWEAMFPIKIFGVEISPPHAPEDTDDRTSPAPCICMVGRVPVIGIPTSFWEPWTITETVADPFCFPTLGRSIPAPIPVGRGDNAGTTSHSPSPETFAHVHNFLFPVDAVLQGLLTGSCATGALAGLFDLLYISEPDPTHGDDILTGFMHPESLLFANPVAQISCIADSVAANVRLPLDLLFWCMGSWGNAYPMTGRINDDREISANAAIAARNIYKRARLGVLLDPALDLCLPRPTAIWIKSHYRFQPVKPVRGEQSTPIGRSSLIWGAGKSPSFAGNNHAWLQFRKKNCCAY